MVVPMRRIVTWTEADIEGLADAWGLSRILTEVDEQGMVTRELGYDVDGNVFTGIPANQREPSTASST